MDAGGPLREVESWKDAVSDTSTDRAICETMLLTTGELGYAQTTVREVARRAGITEERFHRRFGDKEACFVLAYRETAEELAAELVDASQGAADWRDGFRAALARLLRFLVEQPLVAKALLIEARAARGGAWAKHEELVERLVAAFEGAGREPTARPSATAATAGFVVGAIEETLRLEIATGRGAAIERLLPDLTRLAFLQLFGDENVPDAGLERRA
jgi:AcrR family transcriptional regulator